MDIYNSKLWEEDIDCVLAHNPWIEGLTGKSVLITGIGGLICSAVADILIRFNETKNGNVTILAAARSGQKIRERFGKYAERQYFQFVPYEATKAEVNIPFFVDYIIHGASNASPAIISREPVETMISNFTGLLGLLKYGQENGTKRLLYISSSEIYGKKESSEPFTLTRFPGRNSQR